MSNLSYIVVSNIIDMETSTIVGFRVVCIDNGKVYDSSIDTLMKNIVKSPSSFLNVSLDMFNNLVFGTYSNTSNDLPSLTLSGKRLVNESDAITLGHTDTRGNAIAYNAHGEKVVAQMKEYLTGLKSFTNAWLSNGVLKGYFKVDMLDKNYFSKTGLCVPMLYGISLS